MDNLKILQLRKILQLYNNHPQVNRILQQNKNANSNFYLSGLHGSSKSIVATTIINSSNRPHLFIFQDKEDAAYFHNDISNILETEATFFPTSYKRSVIYGEEDSANLLLRS
ncbi:MAG TPA: hypothetical protein VK982_06475, partial [Bacteroidales bacterium]|nr:hypothetical protein [Bacteroidales bacterium]